MLCPNCETDNREEAKFCDQCGFPLPANANEAPIAVEQEGASAQSGGAQGTPQPEGASGEAPALQARDETEAETADEPASATGEQGAQLPATELIDTPPTESSQAVAQDATQAIGYDFAGFDRHSDEYAERLVEAAYAEVMSANHDGGTMQMPRVGAEEPPKSKDYLASTTAQKRGSGKKAAIAAIIIALAAAAAALVTYQMGIWGGKPVPDVVGMTEADARSVLVDEGFSPRVEQVKSDDTEGLVLIEDPGAGERISEGDEVVIHIATARTIPDVAGKSQSDAEKLLADEGYTNVKVKKQNSEKKEGAVISVSPKAGSSALSSAEITLTIAQPYIVPDIAGMAFDDAVDALKKAGLGYDVLYISTDSYPEGTIIGSDPAAGEQVSKGTYVMIQISQARGAQLEEAASAYLSPGSTIDYGGTSYTIESLDYVAYEGDDSVSFTVTARPYIFFFGEILSTSAPQSISGTLTFTEDGEVASIS